MNVEYGTGVGLPLGRWLGKKLGLPHKAVPTSLQVEISHTETSMNWSRQFGDSKKAMTSCFTPLGSYDNGFWTETTDNIEIQLGLLVHYSGALNDGA